MSSKRASIKKSSMFKLEVEKSRFKTHMEEVSNCAVMKTFPDVQEVFIVILVRTLSKKHLKVYSIIATHIVKTLHLFEDSIIIARSMGSVLLQIIL